jgi:hypothetical protein
LKKYINQITFYFVEKGPGRGSEDIKKDVTSFVLIFSSFPFFFTDVMAGKKINLKELH